MLGKIEHFKHKGSENKSKFGSVWMIFMFYISHAGYKGWPWK